MICSFAARFVPSNPAALIAVPYAVFCVERAAALLSCANAAYCTAYVVASCDFTSRPPARDAALLNNPTMFDALPTAVATAAPGAVPRLRPPNAMTGTTVGFADCRAVATAKMLLLFRLVTDVCGSFVCAFELPHTKPVICFAGGSVCHGESGPSRNGLSVPGTLNAMPGFW